MTTIAPERNQSAQSIAQSLSNHRERLTTQQQRIESLTTLFNVPRNNHTNPECLNAIARLIDALDREHQVSDRVYDALSLLACSPATVPAQAKDAPPLTLTPQDNLATYLQLGLNDLAARLKIGSATKLYAAAHSNQDWSKLMSAHPDPEGYQWQFPKQKSGMAFYHKPKLQAIGMKVVEIKDNNSSN